MTDFIYPLASVVLDFFCMLFCIRLAASKRGPVWLIPMILSLTLLLGSAVCLLATASNIAGETLTQVASYMSLFLFVVSVFWLITIIAFAQRTKPNRIIAEDQKALNEANYIKQRTQPKYMIAADRRATANAEIAKVSSIKKAEQARARKTDLYREGPVAMVKLKESSSYLD
ncbi:MAG: hypothetical protein J6X41_07340 [Spirochaetales bacterium]|nr:hypothetical protein [Candidatus Methanomethylophilaceae archaeon]MBP5553174.1 hypothetical protein [Spirochaetales bacterium]